MTKALKTTALLMTILCIQVLLHGQKPGTGSHTDFKHDSTALRGLCAPSSSHTDLNINNVRASLLGGGDMWWNLMESAYIVPNPPPGITEPLRTVIFAGALWLGGYDEGGNLKLASQTYRQRGHDYWPGPLEAETGTTTAEQCANWDRHFTVHKVHVEQHALLAETYLSSGAGIIPDSLIHDELKRWPAKGNPYFVSIFGFDLPQQGLAPFYDYDGDGLYDPSRGDFPSMGRSACTFNNSNLTGFPHQLTFWVFNDAGNTHTHSLGDAIGIEVQALAYAYSSDDELNDMTFLNYRIINHSANQLDSFVISKWVDFDLGCPDDDMLGSDVARDLMYVYNAGNYDGPPGVFCYGQETYEDKVPLAGIRLLSSTAGLPDTLPLMASFTYYFRYSWMQVYAAPINDIQHYRYMTGRWNTGPPFTYGGFGLGGAEPYPWAFPDPPDMAGGWSMCAIQMAGNDYRSVQSTGKFSFLPGQNVKVDYANVWVPNEITYPCPDITRLTYAADKAKYLFDLCFDTSGLLPGPDAPELDIIELDRSLIIVLSNDETRSNNALEQYNEVIPVLPDIAGLSDSSYTFEGYKVYQLAYPGVSPDDYNNPDLARLIFQSDISNDVSSAVNYTLLPGYAGIEGPVYEARTMVNGSNQGIRKTLMVDTDHFSGTPLVNHKRYFYSAVAYAYNNYYPFDEARRLGQRTSYLQGQNNIMVYTGIPRTMDTELQGLSLQAIYGVSPEMIRTDGTGNGGLFAALHTESSEEILLYGYRDSVRYRKGAAPVNVFVTNPLRVKAGNFRLRIYDPNPLSEGLSDQAYWELTDESDPTIKWMAEYPIAAPREQFIHELGLSVFIRQVFEPGETQAWQNGFIQAVIQYADGEDGWFRGLQDGIDLPGIVQSTLPVWSEEVLRLQRTKQTEADYLLDINRVWTQAAEGMWHPYTLLNWRMSGSPAQLHPYPLYISPAWISDGFGPAIRAANPLRFLNSVDIVLTPDKSKWSRCIVVETANAYLTGSAGLPTIDGTEQFDLRTSTSVGKYDLNGDGLADPDGTGTGMGWFPGYAIDVMTGRRLNIFFGENSFYSFETSMINGFENVSRLGGDMMWNPSSVGFADLDGDGLLSHVAELKMGGQHMIYVSTTDYDSCAHMYQQLSAGGNLEQAKRAILSKVTWASFSMLEDGAELLPLGAGAWGLIPGEVTFSLRANHKYSNYIATGNNMGYPEYLFSTHDLVAVDNEGYNQASLLRDINVVPNPYYAWSAYETEAGDHRIRIINLPAECSVSIFSIDGRFVRGFTRNETETLPELKPGILPGQIVTSVDWDLRNESGALISSGVYLIHVMVPGKGERVLKWFGVMRQ